MKEYTTIPSEIFNVYGKHVESMIDKDSHPDVFSMIPHFFFEFNNDPSIVIINAGPVAGPKGLTFVYSPFLPVKNYVQQVTKAETKLFFDNMFEGSIIFELEKIYQIIKNTNIAPSQVYYFSCALDSNKIHDDFCANHNISEKINIYSCNAWEYYFYKSSNHFKIDYQIRKKEKTFLCFNRILRSHRLALLGLLFSKDLVKDSYYSFFPTRYYSKDIDIRFSEISKIMTPATFNRIQAGYEDNKHRLPLRLNIDDSENQNTIKNNDIELFNESYFSLVTETFFFPEEYRDSVDNISIFFSEKIFKPILMKHPFILASRPHCLEYLRKFGYKTFSPFIDESYDTIEDDELRLLAIVDEVSRLNEFTDDQWIEWQHNVLPILEHNYKVISGRKKYEYPFTRNNYETQY